MSKFCELRLGIFEGVLTGIFLGVLHASILATGGLYAMTAPLEIITSFARHAGLVGLSGALMGALACVVLVSKTGFQKRPHQRILHSVPSIMVVLYVLPWLAFIAKECFGRKAIPFIVILLSVLFLTLMVLLAKGQKQPRSYMNKRSRFSPSRRVLVVILIGCLIFYLSPFFLPSSRGTIKIDTQIANPLEPLRFSAAARFAAAASTFATGRWNLLLLTIDTLRSDHLGCYRYSRDTSPAIDELARSGILFTHAFCQRPKTSPSFASILVGTYPSRHGIHEPMRILTPENETLAEYLSGAGWTTAAVITNGNLYPVFGFDQGFETYVFGHKDAKSGANLTIEWLQDHARKNEPWFLWVHFTDPHTPYSPPYPYDEMFEGKKDTARTGLQQQIDLYDGEIRFTDDQMRRILEWLKNEGFLERTLAVFTADHGESLGEHDYYFEHGLHPYEPSAHIPLVLSAPGVISPGAVCSALVGGVDILPTILDAMGVEVPTSVQGRSFLPAVAGMSDEGPMDFVFIEAGYGFHDMAGRTQTIRRGSLKYIHRLTSWASRPKGLGSLAWSMNALLEGGLAPDELYDLESDPGEIRNLLTRRESMSKHERQALKAFAAKLAGEGRGAAGDQPSEIDPATYRALKSLGYLN